MKRRTFQYGIEWVLGSFDPPPWMLWAAFVVTTIVLFTVWAGTVYTFSRLQLVLSMPWDMALRVAEILVTARTWLDIGVSALRVLVGLVLGSVGFVVALVLITFPVMHTTLRVYVAVLRGFSPVSLLLVLSVYTVTGEFPKPFIAFWVTFVGQLMFTLLSAEQFIGIRSIQRTEDREYLDILSTMLPSGLRGRWVFIRHILAVQLLPTYFKALYFVSATNWTLLVLTESSPTLGLHYGIGYRAASALQSDQRFYDIIAYTFVIVICVAVTWQAVWYLQRKVLYWTDEMSTRIVV